MNKWMSELINKWIQTFFTNGGWYIVVKLLDINLPFKRFDDNGISIVKWPQYTKDRIGMAENIQIMHSVAKIAVLGRMPSWQLK